jgi:hypothetical protein
MAYTIGTNIDDGVDLNSARGAVESYLNMDNLTIKSSSGEVEKAEVVNNSVTASKSIIDIYGIRQEIVTQSNKQDPKVTALRKLNDNCTPKEELNVEVIGDVMFRVGYGVHVKFPFAQNYNDTFMYIKELSNEWKNNGIFISALTLTPSRVMDEEEWTDLDGSNSTSSGGGSETAKKIIALLTQQIGKPYEWSKSGPNSFDCSGMLYYCYNQFSNELIDGKSRGKCTFITTKRERNDHFGHFSDALLPRLMTSYGEEKVKIATDFILEKSISVKREEYAYKASEIVKEIPHLSLRDAYNEMKDGYFIWDTEWITNPRKK